MRFLFALVFSLFISSHSFAALVANDWQAQLQSQLNTLKTQSPSIKVNGDVVVTEEGNIFRATLPGMTVTSPDQSTWVIPAIILQASGSSNAMTVTLPTTITRYDAGKKEIARMDIGAQSLNARWNTASNSFESFNGVLRNITFNDTIANTKSSITNVSIAANKGSPVQFIASDIRNLTVQNQKQWTSSIAKLSAIYQLPNADNMTIARLIGYLNPGILMAENKDVVFNVSAEQISMTGDNGRTTSIQKLMSKFNLQPKGATVSGTMNAQLYIVNQTPASPYSFVLPRQADLTANLTNVPVEMISFAPGMSLKMARQAMDKAQTVINITKLNVTTFDNAKLTGNGMLKAYDDTPSGFTGRLTVKIQNLKDIIAANQMQLLQPDNGTDRSAKTQSLMAMMMVQGMGKQSGTDTEFVLDLTSDGQTMVNGQDLSGLIGTKSKAKAIQTVPALPLTPVKSSNL